MIRRFSVVFASATLAILLLAPGVSGQARFGAQVSYADDVDLGLGARVEVPITQIGEGLMGIGSVDWFFPGDEVTYFELNGNLAYGFSIEGADSLFPYAGGGLSLAHSSVEVLGDDISDTDLGFNLLIGSAFSASRIRPFAELRVELGGGEQFVITGGILF